MAKRYTAKAFRARAKRNEVANRLKTKKSGQPTVSAEYLADRVREPGRGRRGRPAHKDYYHPSREGEFPHKDTGHLRRNINLEADLNTDAGKSKVRIGTNVPYAAELELKMKRLLFRETLKREVLRMRQIIETGRVI